MGASYAVMDYMGLFLAVTVGAVVVILALTILLGVCLAKKFRKALLVYLPLLGMAAALFLLGQYILPILEQTGDLLIPDEYTTRITAGRVESIAPAEHAPQHLVDGRLHGADHVWVNGTRFYVISDGKLQEGMLIELEYAHFENDVILRWQETTENRVQQILQNPEIPDDTPKEKPPKVDPEAVQNLGVVIRWIGLLGFAGIFLFSHAFPVKIQAWFLTRDLTVKGKIIPSPANLAISLAPFVFLVLFITGICLASGEYGPLIVILCACLFVFLLLLSEQFTRLEIDGQRITIRKFGKQKQYQISDIYDITWKYGRGLMNKQLRIIFSDSSCYWFAMERYLGVQNAYDELTK